jgi:hypothetical protein
MARAFHSQPTTLVPTLALFVFFSVFLTQPLPTTVQQQRPLKAREKLHDVILRQQLTPQLRSDYYVRFSPDGQHLFAANSEGIYLLSANPLKLTAYIAVRFLYGVTFSEDSKALRAVTIDLRVANWSVEDGHELFSLNLPLNDGCISGKLSPKGNLFACLRPSETVSIYRVADGRAIYSEEGKNKNDIPMRFLKDLGRESFMATPIGFVFENSRASFVNTGRMQLPMLFSPDEQDFIYLDMGVGNRISLSTNKKNAIRGDGIKQGYSTLARVDSDRVVVANFEKPPSLEIRSLSNNTLLQKLSAEADSATLSSDSRYLILQSSTESSSRVLDLKDNHFVDVPTNAGLDILGPDMALWTETGDIFLYHLGDQFPYRATQLPLGYLPALQSAIVDPQLQKIAYSASHKTRVFNIADGKQIFAYPGTNSMVLDADAVHYLSHRRHDSKAHFDISKLEFASKNKSVVTSLNDQAYRPGPSAAIGYSFENDGGFVLRMNFAGPVPFHLTAADPRTGAELWKKSFKDNCPVSFPDPQGSRLVLGWQAQAPEAKKVADGFPELKNLFKKTKINPLDSFFEVVEVKTGKSLGGALLQVGGVPATYDAAFSEGDALILLKEDMRVSLYSIKTGLLITRLTGITPAANGPANLLALNGGDGKLLLYDLNSGAKLDDELFPDDIFYMHFSEDGTRLLVLTARQVVFILDVTKTPRTAVPVSN